MKSYRFNKLVRDKIAHMMKAKGVRVTPLPIESEEQRIQLYKEKLLEEVQEVLAAKNQRDLIEELADCLEVIGGFVKALGVNEEKLEHVCKEKKDQKGGFEDSVAIDYVSLPGDHPFVAYYEENSERYPEIELV